MLRRITPLLERLERAGQDARRVRAEVRWQQAMLIARSDPERSRRLAENSLALYRELDDQCKVAYILHLMSVSAMRRGQLEEAAQLLREVVAMSQGVWTRINSATALLRVAEVCIYDGQFQRARAVLEGSLADFDQLGDTQGSMCRHGRIGFAQLGLGQYEEARGQAERVYALCQEYGLPFFYEPLPADLLACVELVEAQRLVVGGTSAPTLESGESERAYAQAERLPLECVEFYRKHELVGQGQGHLGVVFSLQAMAARGLGMPDQARHNLNLALQASAEEAFMVQVFPISGTALLLADAGEHERAVDLYALASRYPYVANSRWFYDVFGRHIDAIASTLLPDVAEAARERGRARDLQATVKELLAELEGWDSQDPELSHP